MKPFQNRMFFGIFVVILFTAMTAQTVIADEFVRVVDGDTLVMQNADGEYRIRLYGIDTPEHDQPYGAEATAYLEYLLSGGFSFAPVGVDQYDRTIAVLFLPDNTQVQTAMLYAGLAWWYQQYAPDNSGYRDAEAFARRNAIGLWNSTDPIPPWDWR